MGAKAEIARLYEFLHSHQDEISQTLAEDNIKWNPIPARSPHFGGLWESNVRRSKELIKRSVSGYKLTYEEFLTVLADIEFILNSRPLTPLSSSPNDLRALCPSDFLIQGTIETLPEPNISCCNSNILGQWDVISKIRQDFRTRFSKEYLTNLQAKCKWFKKNPNILNNTVVLIKDSNPLNTKWKIGLIEDVIVGKDGVARVVDVRLDNVVKRRAITEIAPLPIFKENSTSSQQSSDILPFSSSGVTHEHGEIISQEPQFIQITSSDSIDSIPNIEDEVDNQILSDYSDDSSNSALEEHTKPTTSKKNSDKKKKKKIKITKKSSKSPIL